MGWLEGAAENFDEQGMLDILRERCEIGMKRLCALLQRGQDLELTYEFCEKQEQNNQRELEQAQERTAQGDWEGAAELSEQAFQSWQDHEAYLHILMRHSDTDEILSSFRALEQYLALEETDQYTAANAELMTQLELLAEMEQPSLVNIF